MFGRASKFLYAKQMLAASSSWYSYMDLVVFTFYYVMFNLVLCNKNIDFCFSEAQTGPPQNKIGT